MTLISQALKDVISERERQIKSEGWTLAHDDQHRDGSLALAGACYASCAAAWAQNRAPELNKDYVLLSKSCGFRWPWAREWWKPKSQRRDLVRAAALIVAEIERLDRLSEAKKEISSDKG